jgi:dihydrofolate reductase
MARKVYLFMMVSLDGYFEGVNHDLSWHNADEEFLAFSSEQLTDTGTILFGHRTYKMMSSFWPTPQGIAADPATAKFMDEIPKVVASSNDFKPDWKNTSVVSHNVIVEIQKLKQERGKDIALLGSNKLCVSLMEARLVDEFRIMVNPVALGRGSSLFTGLSKKANLQLIKARQFKSGNILNYYSL